ncbi:MAG: hypothetical protein OQJ93_08115 [Ignavibacteriaceae bacterium]|jgi:hypothetical protein|nr:hypothetical protein [Ignavibacteriaceae bacterium]MCW8813471.1 hypothetical protein [Chlorobium sp.]MCW8996478.1 hypothetical protein [Psychromonas sp.]MCW8816244.1 hypothetical protein [Ignavibacteriaceae bacterium]MCW8823256.1 hypothetical protein [Ignavibacteriaceae bacterium]
MIFLIIINEYKACSKNNAFIPYVETGINNKLYAEIKPGKKAISESNTQEIALGNGWKGRRL